MELKVSSREAHKVQLALTVDTDVGKLEMDFLSNVSTLTWCRESVGFNECLLKVKLYLMITKMHSITIHSENQSALQHT